MIKIFIQNKFVAEKKYVLNYIFGEIYNTEYEILTDNEPLYRFVSDNYRLIIDDVFFSNFEDGYKYFQNIINIPTDVDFMTCEGFSFAIPILFGKDELRNEDGLIYCGNDIIAAIFFMLTRWEEIANKTKDKHDRFDEKENLSIKYGFHKRPIVNDYISVLAKMLNDAGIEVAPSQRDFRLFLTHDIDFFARYDKFGKIVKALLGDIFRRKNFKIFFNTLKTVYKQIFKKAPDVYDKFDFFMDISETKNVKSEFYFIPGLKGEEGITYSILDKKIKKTIHNIKERNHIIGIHPSYSSYNNVSQLKREVNRLYNLRIDVSQGRQHFLRYLIPQTFRDWEVCNLKIDSGMGFNSNIGFRCGICYEFPLFDVELRNQLQLRERPLIVMDKALRARCENQQDCVNESVRLANIVKSYNGDFVLLWHNSNLVVNEWEGWDSIYKEIVEGI
ncbi:MAG TPA: polysaccharide deacetylase family protein [Bacteroidales bacterium]|jgi:hypothetical protein|nr:polysaccharide deacetylase family protein [Bacteroidales bacterium]HOD88485.1 polysaccharide deacetylase family protein [Bacteroidales bacterium]